RAAPAPELVGTAGAEGWFALVMSVAPGTAAGPPWSDDGTRLVGEACAVAGGLRAPDALPRIGELLTDLDGWDRLAGLDDWEREHVATLAGHAQGWRDWTAGKFLVHQDVRGDNALVDVAAGRATLVDWSFACAGASWLDRARLAADLVAAGHRDGPAAALRAAGEVLSGLPEGASRFVVALAGMWRYRSTLPPLPGLPGLRDWQAARARALRPLLARLIR
ncbi:phosphotransferase, partial [Actinoplanes sp. NPDC049596]